MLIMPFVIIGVSRGFIIENVQKGDESQSFGVGVCHITV